ncbi:hypothetical protein BC828DRAFT_124740 [Blastocladiella britannica]|nr:hypothetical protein BC828DRAFT_124740 [Blastocladiella britannica]
MLAFPAARPPLVMTTILAPRSCAPWPHAPARPCPTCRFMVHAFFRSPARPWVDCRPCPRRRTLIPWFHRLFTQTLVRAIAFFVAVTVLNTIK